MDIAKVYLLDGMRVFNYIYMTFSVWVQCEANSLQYPMWDVFVRSKICLKNQSNTHSIASFWCYIDRCPEGVLQETYTLAWMKS